MEVRRRRSLLLALVVVGLAAAGCSVGEYGAEQQSMSPDATQMSGGANEASSFGSLNFPKALTRSVSTMPPLQLISAG